MAKESMMIITSVWNDQPTIKMISTSLECPFNECIYDVDNKVLAVISKEKYTKPHMMPKLDNHGRPKVVKGKNADGQVVEMQSSERIFTDAFYEHYIEDASDIREFISYFAINPKHKGLSIINDTKPVVEKKKAKKA
jgi:hypothetical protein